MMKECSIQNLTDTDVGTIPGENESSECPVVFHELSPKMVKKRSIRNLFIFSICYFLVYSGFWSLSNLQSTMNASGGIGDLTQAGIYAFAMISSLFFPKYLIERFGCKTMIITGTFVCCIYMAANADLRVEVLMPASILFGLIQGPFIAAQTLYVDEIATRFHAVHKGNFEFVIATFFGVFMIFGESTQIWGNLISYYILSIDDDSRNVTVKSNYSDCGIDFDPSKDNTNFNLKPPTETTRLILVGSYVLLGLIAVLILIFFLDPLKNDVKESNGCRSICNRFLSAMMHLKNFHQVLLIPISVYIGMEGPLYTNEVTEAYIACSWGVHHVGFVTVCFGVCGAVTALLVGPLVKYITQMGVLILAASANLTTCILLYFWKPNPDSVVEYFAFAGVWGMGDAIWWSQITALYGLMFPNDREAAFSNLYFWSFLGFFLSYAYANYLNVAVKINILLCFLITGMLGYLIGQFKIKCSARREYVIIAEDE